MNYKLFQTLKMQQNQNIQIQRQLSTLQSQSRPKTIEEIKRIEDMYGKELDLPRSGFEKSLNLNVLILKF